MANPIKDRADIGQNWTDGVSGASGRLERGIRNPKRDWRQNTLAAAERHKAAVILAANEGRFAKGVSKVTQADYIATTARKAVERWPSGVAGAIDKYLTGFDPYIRALAAQTLPPRGPRRSQANLDRMIANVKTMIITKETLMKSGA